MDEILEKTEVRKTFLGLGKKQDITLDVTITHITKVLETHELEGVVHGRSEKNVSRWEYDHTVTVPGMEISPQKQDAAYTEDVLHIDNSSGRSVCSKTYRLVFTAMHEGKWRKFAADLSEGVYLEIHGDEIDEIRRRREEEANKPREWDYERDDPGHIAQLAADKSFEAEMRRRKANGSA